MNVLRIFYFIFFSNHPAVQAGHPVPDYTITCSALKLRHGSSNVHIYSTTYTAFNTSSHINISSTDNAETETKVLIKMCLKRWLYFDLRTDLLKIKSKFK